VPALRDKIAPKRIFCTSAPLQNQSNVAVIQGRTGQSAQNERFTHYMAVDNGRGKVGLLVDLTGLQHSSVNPDSFVDPCIVEVTWGLLPRPDGKGGTIFVEGGMG
jgi:hypothetical protein